MMDSFEMSDYWRSYMYNQLRTRLPELGLSGKGVEFGGSNGVIQSMLPKVSFETRYYPEYDVLEPSSWQDTWDVAVMDQVLEHVKKPWEVFTRLASHVKKAAIITLPYLGPIHPCPDDYWRLTPSAIRELAGNDWREIEIGTWGNAEAAYLLSLHGFNMEALLSHVSMEELIRVLNINDETLPVMIWAILRK